MSRHNKPKTINEFIEVNRLDSAKTISIYFNNLKSAGKGSIVLFSTVAVQTGMPYHASVASSKGAVEGLTRTLAAEFAPIIRVNCIAPSITNTPLAEKLLNNETKVKASEDRHLLKRTGNAEEIAQTTEFLLSEKHEFITGQIIRIPVKAKQPGNLKVAILPGINLRFMMWSIIF